MAIFDEILLRRDGVASNQWPKLSCTQANQMALEVSNLRLDADRDILFQGNGQIRSSNSDRKLVFDQTNNRLELHELGDIRFLTGSPSPTERMRLLANGNLGIGTDAPQAPLEVVGKVKATEFEGDGAALTGKVSTAGDAMTGSLTIDADLNVSGAIATAQLQVSDRITSPLTIDGNLAVNGTVKGTTFEGDGSQLTGISSGKWSDGSSNSIFYNNGNVGIGTSDPTQKLHIERGELRVRASHNNTTADIGAFYAHNLTQGIGIGYDRIEAIGSNSAQDIRIRPKGTGQLIVEGILRAEAFRSATDDWEIARNGENLEIREPEENGKVWARFNDDRSLHLIGTPNLWVDGSVGIGTTEPKGTQHIVGDLALGKDLNNQKFIFHSRTNGSGDFLQITSDNASGNWDWSKGIILRREGSVGIGTTNPSESLEVNGTVKATNFQGNGAAIAYANISSGGAIASITPNVTSAAWNSGQKWYEIRIAGEDYFWTRYVTIVTPLTQGLTVATGSVGSQLLIYFFDRSGNRVQPTHGFQFVTYKP